MNDYLTNLKTLRDHALKARDYTASSAVNYMSSNPNRVIELIDTAIAAHRRLAQLDEIIRETEGKPTS